MAKHVEEDWSFFNIAVREKAESRPQPETPTLRVVTPDLFPLPPPIRYEQKTATAPVATGTPANTGFRPSISQPSIRSGTEAAVAPESSAASSGMSQRSTTQPNPADPELQGFTPSETNTNPASPVPPSPIRWFPFGRGPRDSKLPTSTVASTTMGARSRQLTDNGVNRIIFWFLCIFSLILLFMLALASRKNADWSRLSAASMGQSDVVQRTGGSTEAVVTDYTTFNRVAFKDWSVVTGWNFARNGDISPTAQYCYLEISTSVGRQTYNIEGHPAGAPEQRPDVLIPGLDDAGWREAATKCRWHS